MCINTLSFLQRSREKKADEQAPFKKITESIANGKKKGNAAHCIFSLSRRKRERKKTTVTKPLPLRTMKKINATRYHLRLLHCPRYAYFRTLDRATDAA